MALTILYAEDEEWRRKEVVPALEAAGHAVIAVDNGARAYRQVEESDINFDLLITDHQMPALKGLELLAIIRKDDAHKALPVIVHSSDPTLDRDVKKLGGVFVSKGSLDNLLAAVGKVADAKSA